VFFGELALAAEILECALQLFCEVFKHDWRPETAISGPAISF
jgi:hypothetical protein